MEWMKAIEDAVTYIEAHITEDIDTEAVARHVCISPFYFQKGFSMLCGYTVAEYIRNRRLALAGTVNETQPHDILPSCGCLRFAVIL